MSKAWIAFIGVILVIVIIAVAVIVMASSRGSSNSTTASLYNIPLVQVNPTPMRVCITSGTRRTAPWINVTSPNGGQLYAPGQQITVTWTSCNIPVNAAIHIGLGWSGFNSPIGITGVQGTNSGSATFVLPGASNFSGSSPLLYGQYYKMVVSTPASVAVPGGAQDASDNLFTIQAGTTTCAFACVTLNGNPTSNVGASTIHAAGQQATFTIPVTVTAGSGWFNNGQTYTDVYVPSAALQILPAAESAIKRVQFGIDTAGTFVSTGATAVFTPVGSIPLTANNNYKVIAGHPQNFNLTITFNPTTAGPYRATLLDLPWSYSDATAAGSNAATGFVDNAGTQINFTTPYVVIQ